MEGVIGTLVVAGLTLIGFVTVFVKLGARFAVLETKVTMLENLDAKRSDKLEEILNQVQQISLNLAILMEERKTYKKDRGVN